MVSTKFSKALARATRSIRARLKLTTPRSDDQGFVLNAAKSTATEDRLAALEENMGKLADGWNQHIPQFLAAAAAAHSIAHDGATKAEVARLKGIISDLSIEMERLGGSIEDLQHPSQSFGAANAENRTDQKRA